MSYRVTNTFEIFGAPCPETYETLQEARMASVQFARDIAECFLPPDADGRVRVEPREGMACGFADEVQFMDDLAEMSEEMGGIPFEVLVDEVRGAAIEIESI
jgi:hypothetical protein